MIEIREPRPPVPAEALAAAEAQLAELGHRIPPSYRGFLAEQDGGRPVKRNFTFEQHGRIDDDRLDLFYGIGPSLDGDLVRKASFGDLIPPGLLPIASDGSGNVICIDTRDGRDGPVLFLDHEEGSDPPDDSNLYPIAPDLQTFLDLLIEDPDPPATPPAKRRGWRSVFTR